MQLSIEELKELLDYVRSDDKKIIKTLASQISGIPADKIVDATVCNPSSSKEEEHEGPAI